MPNSSPNIVNISKCLIFMVIIVTIYVTYLLSKPILDAARNQTLPITQHGRDKAAEQLRLHGLNEIVKENSDTYRPVTETQKKITALIVCWEKLFDEMKVATFLEPDLPNRTTTSYARQFCKKKNMCAPRNRRYETMLRVSPKYKMVNCVVQKSMSTMMTGAMCYLYDEEAFTNAGRSFDDEFQNRFCGEKNEFSSVEAARNAFNISLVKTDWSFSMVTRDPIDRFVSGYLDRCIRIQQPNGTEQCNGCGLNMTCFIETEFERVMTIANKGKVRRTMEDAHFFPQIWHCDLHEELEYFEFLRYSKDAEEMLIPQLDDLLQRQNVPRESRNHVKSQLMYKRADHSTVDTPARRFYYSRLMSSPFLLEYICIPAACTNVADHEFSTLSACFSELKTKLNFKKSSSRLLGPNAITL